jgi:hypothetical protein
LIFLINDDKLAIHPANVDIYFENRTSGVKMVPYLADEVQICGVVEQ